MEDKTYFIHKFQLYVNLRSCCMYENHSWLVQSIIYERWQSHGCQFVIPFCVLRNFEKIHATHTPNANMADHSVGARDESNESEANQALMFCFDIAFPEKSCFVVDLVPFFRPPFVFLCV